MRLVHVDSEGQESNIMEGEKPICDKAIIDHLICNAHLRVYEGEKIKTDIQCS